MYLATGGGEHVSCQHVNSVTGDSSGANLLKLNHTYIPLCLVGSNQSLRQALTQLILSKLGADKLRPFVASLNAASAPSTHGANAKHNSARTTSSEPQDAQDAQNHGTADSSLETDALFKLDSSVLLQAMVDYLKSTDRKVILVIDELGKFLHNAIHDHDIYFLQELAEIAARSQGYLVCLGILHQSFDAYIHNFEQQVREEWVKVQGRFENQVLHPSAFEILNLIGASLDRVDYIPQHNFTQLTQLLYSASPFLDKIQKTLQQCLPLHPLTAMLLSALSLKSYGQNERSIFGFMNSYEPHSFTSFLNEQAANSQRLYMPDDLFDYIKVNQQVMLTHSPDGHLFTQALEILQFLENKCSQYEVRLFKTLVMINLLGNLCKLNASSELLDIVYPDMVQAVQLDLAAQAQRMESQAQLLQHGAAGAASTAAAVDGASDSASDGTGDAGSAAAGSEKAKPKSRRRKAGEPSSDQIKQAQAKLEQAQLLLKQAENAPVFEQALQTLNQLKAIIYRSYNNTYNIFGGSDFDFEYEFKQQLAKTTLDFNVLEQLYAEDQIVLAKRHYMQTGNLRFMEIKLVQSRQAITQSKKVSCANDLMGVIFLTFVEEGFKLEQVIQDLAIHSASLDHVVFAVVPQSQEIMQLCREFQALKELAAKTAHSGDKVATKELQIHCNESQKHLQEHLLQALNQSIVIYHQRLVQLEDQDQPVVTEVATAKANDGVDAAQSGLEPTVATVIERYWQHSLKACNFVVLVSEIADQIFNKAPYLVNELINHNKISSNISGARNKLLKAMCEHAAECDLGFTGTPPEASIYWTLFTQHGMHRPAALSADDALTVQSELSQEQAAAAADSEAGAKDGDAGTGASAAMGAVLLDQSLATSVELEPVSAAPLYQFFLDDQVESRYRQLFVDTLDLISQRNHTSAGDIYQFWAQRPYGIKDALHPILMLYFILVTQQQVALYHENLPVLDYSADLVDLVLVHKDQLTFKYTLNHTQNFELLGNIFEAVSAVAPQVVNSVCRNMGLPPAFTMVTGQSGAAAADSSQGGLLSYAAQDTAQLVSALPSLRDLQTAGFVWTALDGKTFSVNANLKLEALLTPLFVSRALVRVVLVQKKLTGTTTHLANRCLKMRAAVTGASDPFKLLFEDLGQLYPDLEQHTQDLKTDLVELVLYYNRKLQEVNELLLKSLKHDPAEPLSKLNERATNIKNLSADLELKSFINKLADYRGDALSIERIINGCTNTPSKDFSEKDILNAKLAIQKLAFDFRKTEGFALAQGRDGLRSFISFTTSSSEQGDLNEIIELDADQQSKVQRRAQEMTGQLIQGMDYQEALGVLAQLANLVQQHYK